MELIQSTQYPWDGTVELTVNPERECMFSLYLRIPGWAEGASMEINGERAAGILNAGSYREICRNWAPGDKVRLSLPMPVQKVKAHPRVTNNAGCMALKRGPVVYCIESVDYPEVDIFNLILPLDNEFVTEYHDDVLGGVIVIGGEAMLKEGMAGLYSSRPPVFDRRIELTAVPYFAWANREPGAMRLWLPVG